MELRQVEWLEEVKIGMQSFGEKDRTTLPKVEADQYIALGWCKCVETGEVGTRVAGAKRLAVHDNVVSVG